MASEAYRAPGDLAVAVEIGQDLSLDGGLE